MGQRLAFPGFLLSREPRTYCFHCASTDGTNSFSLLLWSYYPLIFPFSSSKVGYLLPKESQPSAQGTKKTDFKLTPLVGPNKKWMKGKSGLRTGESKKEIFNSSLWPEHCSVWGKGDQELSHLNSPPLVRPLFLWLRLVAKGNPLSYLFFPRCYFLLLWSPDSLPNLLDQSEAKRERLVPIRSAKAREDLTFMSQFRSTQIYVRDQCIKNKIYQIRILKKIDIESLDTKDVPILVVDQESLKERNESEWNLG